MEKGNRNISIDVFRGIAAMMIVFHHVACYSGAVYSPYEIIPSTMIIDVPAFLFISGWAFQYMKSFPKMIKRLFRLLFEYVIFGVLILAVKHFIKDIKRQKYLYFGVTIISIVLFYYLQKGHSIPGLSVTTLFYGTFFMMGYVLMSEKTIPVPYIATAFVINFFVLIGLEHFTDMSIYGMVNNKFPPSILFFVYSLFYIMIMMVSGHYSLKDNRFLSYMGRNAIYFFFAQGFAVSLINLADDLIKIENWVIKYTFSCIIALGLTVIIAVILKKLIELVWRTFSWVAE